jgi:hypothetical protein
MSKLWSAKGPSWVTDHCKEKPVRLSLYRITRIPKPSVISSTGEYYWRHNPYSAGVASNPTTLKGIVKRLKEQANRTLAELSYLLEVWEVDVDRESIRLLYSGPPQGYNL